MPNIKHKGRTVTYDDVSRESRTGARQKLSRTNEYFTHFAEITTIPAGLVLVNTGAVAAATYGTGLSGRAVLTSDDVAAVGVWLTHTGLLWQPSTQTSSQPLVFETRASAGATITTAEYFFGWTDALAAVDDYALSVTSTFTTSAPANAAKVGWSSTPTSGAAFQTGGNPFVGVASNTSVDQLVADASLTTAGVTTGRTLAASTFYTFRVEVDVAGNAVFFIDETFMGSIGGALVAATPVVPQIGVTPRATAGGAERVLTADYFYAGGV